jgi:hypothetical protein
MFYYRGKLAEDVMLQVNCEIRNPYDAVENVFVGSARPLDSVDRIAFIAENIEEVDRLCMGLYEDWKENRLLDSVPVKRPTHTAPPTLQ